MEGVGHWGGIHSPLGGVQHMGPPAFHITCRYLLEHRCTGEH